MHKKTFFLIVILSALSFGAWSQNYQQQFRDLSAAGDTAAQGKVLQQWAAAKPNDPELFIAYFNYYVFKSRSEILSLDKDKKAGESLALIDSTGKTAGYMNTSLQYNPQLLQKGLEYIDKGISLHPTRLDMRFGKVYMLGQMGDYASYTKTITTAVDYGNSIDHKWLWKDGKPLQDAKQFFINTLQEYVVTIYNTENDDLLPYMRQISESVLKYMPGHVESLSNVALTYLVKEEYDKALPYLLKAEGQSPKDIVILNNIAVAYAAKKDKANAKAYYEKIIKHGNREEAENAKNKIKAL